MNDNEVREPGFRLDKSIVRMGFDAGLALVVASVGFMVNSLYGELRDIKAIDVKHTAALESLRERLPIEYVRMEQYVRDRQEMLMILNRIDTNVREHREAVIENRRNNHAP